MQNYCKTITREGKYKTLSEWMNIDQFFSEEICNYFDSNNKAQMESLLMLLNEAYEMGRKDKMEINLEEENVKLKEENVKLKEENETLKNLVDANRTLLKTITSNPAERVLVSCYLQELKNIIGETYEKL